MPRKHLIASGINKKQQQQSKIWMKCAKEIKAAAKVGGPNPDANPRLKAAIQRALQNNLSRDSIQKNINGATKDPEVLKEILYEGYGPKGIAIIVKALTDNEQRTISNVRGYFSKLHGEISKPNSVKMLFNEYGVFLINKKYIDENRILEITMDFNVIDVHEFSEFYEVLVETNDFYKVKNAFDEFQVQIESFEIKHVPVNEIEISEEEKIKLDKFFDSCEDDDDIQMVISNVKDYY